jgi:lipid II:glycine glycyltransferase (peptidoglycan interpeptide bridge formation enzyme)
MEQRGSNGESVPDSVRLEPVVLSDLQGRNFFQSGFWGAFKSRFGWNAKGYTFQAGGRRGQLMVLAREVSPGMPVLYVPYGPDADLPSEKQGPFLEQLSESVRRDAPAGSVFLRYDLPWETPYAQTPHARDTAQRTSAATQAGDIRPAPRVREMRMNFGTAWWNLRKSPTNVLPSDTVVIDLTRPQDALLRNMKPKTRYNVRLSERKGVRVEQPGEAGLERELADWHRLMLETSRRHGIVSREYRYFHDLLRTGRGFGPRSPGLLLLLARKGGELAAGAIVAIYQGRAIYLYGASSYRLRHCMPAYALQWSIMQLARSEGCTTYDLFGIPPTADRSHPMHGLYRFKNGFGGRRMHRRGCWDYPLSPDYQRCRGAELSGTEFHRG